MEMDWKSIGIDCVDIAANGLEELECIKRTPPDIILQDIKMPGMDGLTLTAYLKDRQFGAKVILLTGYGTFENAVEGIRQGVFDYLLKPAAPNEIMECVKRAVCDIKSRNALGRVDASRRICSELQKGDASLMDKIIAYIEEGYNKPLSLVRLADELHFNPVYLSRFIKKNTGINFVRLVQMVRTVHAAHLLAQTDLKISEVCDRVGMDNQRYFSQIFKALYGVTPTEYRRCTHPAPETSLLDFIVKNSGRMADMREDKNT